MFEQVFTDTVGIYRTLQATAYVIWSWLSSEATIFNDFFELPADTTYLEVMIGAVLITCLVTAAVKFFTPLG